jgi:thiol:disulfide interchange protein
MSFTSSGGTTSAFSTGLLASFVATPCTGPFMAAAMGAALLLPPLSAMLLFAALGIGLALPFLLLGFVPAFRRLLPKPGNWMNTFRKVMAVPMGLTALALLWLAWRMGGESFAIYSAIAVALLVALLFWIGRKQSGGGEVRRAAWIAAPAMLALAVVLLPRTADLESTTRGESILDAQPYSADALSAALQEGKPVFLWFTADWCVTCKVNEGIAIEREGTREAFERAGVVPMVGDWTRRDPEITQFLTSEGAAGVPLYIWYDPKKGKQQLPQVLTPDSLTDLAANLPPAS